MNDDDDDEEEEEEEEELSEAEKIGVGKEESETVSDDITTSCVGALSSTSNNNQTDDTNEEIATQIKSCEFRPIHPSTPTCPVNPAYLPFTYSYSTNASADCFMKPPFTVVEERWIVKTDNHPFKHYVLQCWEDMLQSALQQCAPQQHCFMSRTSSEKELTSIFENDDQQRWLIFYTNNNSIIRKGILYKAVVKTFDAQGSHNRVGCERYLSGYLNR